MRGYGFKMFPDKRPDVRAVLLLEPYTTVQRPDAGAVRCRVIRLRYSRRYTAGRSTVRHDPYVRRLRKRSRPRARLAAVGTLDNNVFGHLFFVFKCVCRTEKHYRTSPGRYRLRFRDVRKCVYPIRPPICEGGGWCVYRRFVNFNFIFLIG